MFDAGSFILPQTPDEEVEEIREESEHDDCRGGCDQHGGLESSAMGYDAAGVHFRRDHEQVDDDSHVIEKSNGASDETEDGKFNKSGLEGGGEEINLAPKTDAEGKTSQADHEDKQAG